MGKTFIAQKTNGTKKIGISLKELHANLWYIDKKETYLDVGLLLAIPLDGLSNDITIKLQLPFKPLAAPEDLTQALNNGEIIQLLFNESFNKTEFNKNYKKIVNIKLPSSDRGEFCLITPSMKIVDDGNVNVSYSAEELHFAATNTHHPDVAYIYSRIRIHVDFRRSFGLELLKNEINEDLVCDIRLNDTRMIENAQKTYNDIIPVDRFLFFLITPGCYNIILEPEKNKKHVRRLEDEWQTYIPQLSKRPNCYFVSYWRADEVGTSSKNFLIRARKEKRSTWENLLSVFYISISLYIVTNILTSVDITKVLEELSLSNEMTSKINSAYTIIVNSGLPILGALLVSVIASAIWSLVSYSFNVERLFNKNKR